VSKTLIYAVLFFGTFPALILGAWALDRYLPTPGETTAKSDEKERRASD
jgi:hypothetical protein